MKRIDIKVPIEYQYLSQWTDFDSILPEGHILLNKDICGCRCNDYYLTNGQPNILVSPRRNLITSKLKNGRTAGKLFYFDRSSGTMDDTVADMDNYLLRCNPNPFDGRSLVPKIMVTYDSLPYLKEALINRNMMDKFNLVVDEFTCIFTDVKLKGSTEINLLHELNTLPNRIVYISATPLKEAYLELLGEFKDMPYVSLKWDPSRIETANIIPRSMKSTSWAIEQIIQKYRAQGFFKSKIINGKQINSTEAVFFLNSVKDIASIIKKNGLEPNETLVICADETKNRSLLRKVNHSIGTVPNEIEYTTMNKTFTFVTKCAFEGTDFYSDCSTTYVFSDCNRDNLSLDISTDLRQIAGRCRSRSNPFRNEIYYYYKNADMEDGMNERQMIEYYNQKRKETMSKVQTLENITDKSILDKFKVAQKVDKYTKDYLDVEDHGKEIGRVVCNDVAYVADLHAVEIKMQNKDSCQMLCYMKDSGFNTVHEKTQQDRMYQQFYQDFFIDSNFERRMKLYVDTVQCHPELIPRIEASSVFPVEFKKYYRELGSDRIKRAGYIEAKLKRLLEDSSRLGNVNLTLELGIIYSNAKIKAMIQEEYNRLGIKKAAKAKDITEYVTDAVPTRFMDENGKKQHGYKLLNKD